MKQKRGALWNELVHGAQSCASVRIDHYNAELHDGQGFVGDRANRRAFCSILDDWRQRMSQAGEDPLGDQPTEKFRKKELDQILIKGEAEAAGLLSGAIEEFARGLAAVTHRLLSLPSWQKTEHVVVGGGFRASRIGELAIGRASVLLKTEHSHEIELRPIRHDPDEAGLLGTVHLIPAHLLEDYDSMLGVDIGGSNIRAGIVELNLRKNGSFGDARVCCSELWRHAEEKVSRIEAVERLAEILEKLIRKANQKNRHLAPYLGLGCPGVIGEDGSIQKGGQNLPGGNWESSRFNLPKSLQNLIPKVGKSSTVVLLHNDAVVQGLSEAPWMEKAERWGVLTIGTGLGNARFTNCLH